MATERERRAASGRGAAGEGQSLSRRGKCSGKSQLGPPGIEGSKSRSPSPSTSARPRPWSRVSRGGDAGFHAVTSRNSKPRDCGRAARAFGLGQEHVRQPVAVHRLTPHRRPGRGRSRRERHRGWKVIPVAPGDSWVKPRLSLGRHRWVSAISASISVPLLGAGGSGAPQARALRA